MIALPLETSTPRADRLAGLFAPAVVDLFAGMGGWSVGAEQAFVDGGYRDRYVDLMVNHWDAAVGVHSLNHPMTSHLHASVWEVDPNDVLPGRPIVYLHASPDCTDFSKAKGSAPKRKHIRALADVVLVWAGKRRPRVITLENVEEFKDWGPLLASGQPDPARRGHEFRRWKAELEALGYVVDHRELRACDYGAPTTRKRLFVVARCDGLPIVWPEPSHGVDSGNNELQKRHRCGTSRTRQSQQLVRPAEEQHNHRHSSGNKKGSQDDRRDQTQSEGSGIARAQCGATRWREVKPYRTAAECIDWHLPMLSIFATPAEATAWAATINTGREKVDRVGVPRRPLKEKTLQRIARGLDKFVLKAKKPFIVRVDNVQSNSGCAYSADTPLTTVTSAAGHAVVDLAVAPIRVSVDHTKTTGRGRYADSLEEPMKTVTAANGHAVAAATLQRYNGAKGNEYRGQPADAPLSTLDTQNRHSIVAATLQTLNHGGPEHRAQSPADPLHTVTGANDARAMVAALLTKHYGGVTGQAIDKGIGTVTGVDHHAVTCAHLLKFRGESPGTAADAPVDTITAGSSHGRPAGAGHAMGVTCAYLSHFYTSNTCGGEGDPTQPAKTITSGGQHAAVTVAMATPYIVGTGGAAYAAKPKAIDEPANTVMVNDRQALVAAFLQTYYGNGGATCPSEPAPTVTGHDRIGLVTVVIEEQTYVVTDIAMRMLTPRELARAQGFDDRYVIDRTVDGTRVSKADQVKLIGNSVPPPFARAIVRANVVDMGVLDEAREAVSA